MSRGIARALYTLVSGLTAPMSRRQRLKTLARLRERIGEEHLVTVTTRHGPLRFDGLASAFSASAAERFLDDEPETLEWIDGFDAGAIFWDVGASIGVYSLYAALHPGITTLAFEPSGFSFGLLMEHIALNGAGDRIEAFCIALGDADGIDRLHLRHVSAGAGGSALTRPESQSGEFQPLFSQAVQAFSIDGFRAHYRLPAATHIKIDVDGIEPRIVRGAAATLREVESVMIEVEHRTEADVATEIVEPLTAAGLAEVPVGGSRRNRLFRRPRTA